MNNLLINEIETKIRIYLETIHPKESNGFIIRLADCINTIYERRRSYIIKFPLINQLNINNIVDKWSMYAIDNIIEDYDINKEFTIVSIDPLKISTNQIDITICYSGYTINPEFLIKKLCIDIIEQMNKHLIELYMDVNYPDIDIEDPNDREKFNEIFDNLDMNELYNIYSTADIYIPLQLKSSTINDTIFYINGTISTTYHIINIVDSIRNCLDTDDIQEDIIYDKDDIIFKFNCNNLIH